MNRQSLIEQIVSPHRARAFALAARVAGDLAAENAAAWRAAGHHEGERHRLTRALFNDALTQTERALRQWAERQIDEGGVDLADLDCGREP